ncbi:MAG TPA: hypothetical protein VGQ09_11055 [Chitinophagaceae bacterium]|jgi:hypothetical protein|nr:hypothetical protein [Chitinophagaceae bacterium]
MQAITPPLKTNRKNNSNFKKFFLLIFLIGFISSSLHSQLLVAKSIGKNSDSSKLGFGAFIFWEIPVNDIGNRSVMIELMDLAFFPPKSDDAHTVIGYLSIRLGYRYIFSQETKTGFYIEPSAGYCRVVSNEDRNDGKAIYGDGIALATEVGYTVEVGQNGNSLNFGVKYETDRAGSKTTCSSIAFRASYSFHMFRKGRD